MVRPSVAAGPPPLLVLAHGYGSNEHDLFELVSFLDPRLLVVSARAPYLLMPGSYAWFEIAFTNQGIVSDQRAATHSAELLAQFVAEAAAAYGADPQRIMLGGFSQGASMAAIVALSRPDLIAAAAVLSGLVPAEITDIMPAAEHIAGRRFFVAHGTQDGVVPISNGRAIRRMLESLPVELTYREYAMAHTISPECLADLRTWLHTQIE
ncbi:MAG TPA: PHB depolymerase family esterase [Roseiflexaceae bacterium]|nr:PHB depolymerase family esterase [Roseiflexaceae bacterium]